MISYIRTYVVNTIDKPDNVAMIYQFTENNIHVQMNSEPTIARKIKSEKLYHNLDGTIPEKISV